MAELSEWLTHPWIRAGVIALGSVLAALIIELVFRYVILALTRRTETDLDDKIAHALRRPIHGTVILVGLAWAIREAPLPRTFVKIGDGLFWTIAIVVWAVGLARVITVFFGTVAQNARARSFIQPRTLPLFDIFGKVLVFAASSYAILLAWHVNIAGWMASAGIAGIALGFAAKDSLSNLFAGIFIIVDAPYSLGDFIVLDGELRGAVTAIGIRSTRLLTLDDIEIIVPNSLIGNAQIVNESGGPYHRARVAVQVECAYGSDVDQVKEVMLQCAEGARHVEEDPKPLVRFSSFGSSGLVHELLIWIEHPRYRETVIDDLNRRIYKAFGVAGIEIPYSKHDVFIKQIAGSLSPSLDRPS